MTYRQPAQLDTALRVGGYQSADRALLLVRDWSAPWNVSEPSLHTNVHVTINGLAPGAYVVEYWNTQHGDHTDARVIVSGANTTLQLPGFQRALALKIRRA
jgi:hypothetical protein